MTFPLVLTIYRLLASLQIPESLELKTKLFKDVQDMCSASTVFATSTKELSIDHIQYVCYGKVFILICD